MTYWAKRHETLGGRWVAISFTHYLYLKLWHGVVTCRHDGYPPESKDRGFAHSAARTE